MPREVLKVLIGAEECQAVPDAQLGDQRVNCSKLNSSATARVAQCGGLDVIIAIRNQERHSGKPLENLGMRLGSREPLQQLLKNEPGRENGFPCSKGVAESSDLGNRLRRIPPQSQ